MKREVWFNRFLLSYWPCHWKGWVVTAIVYFFGAMSIILGQSTHGFSALPFLLLFLPSWIWFMIMAIRHS